MLSPQIQQKILTTLLKRPQNQYCSDCNGKSPCWVSLDFGVFVCMNCSGAHRALGPSITRVRSTKLDTWNKDWVENMKIGNSVLNQYWEKQLPLMSSTLKPNVNSSLTDIKKYVFDKYVKKKFVDSDQQYDPLTRLKKGLYVPKTDKDQQTKVTPSSDRNIQVTNKRETSDPQTKQIYKKHIYNTVKESTLSFSKEETFKKPTQQQNTKNNVDLLMFSQIDERQEVHNFNQSKQTKKFDFNFQQVQFQKPKLSQHQHPQTLKKEVTFENFLQNISSKSESSTSKPHPVQQQPLHGNYFMSPQGFVNTTSQYTHLQHGYSQPSHNLPQLTMNINMNMYPNVMNINMGNTYSSINPYNQPQQLSSPLIPHLPAQTTNKGFQYNDFFTNGVKPPLNLNTGITLDLTMKENETKKENKDKSWVDDWM